MANRTLNTRLRLKYDTAANWATKNPVLLAGEAGIESDTLLGKVGDGTKAWQQLDYLNANYAKRVPEVFGVVAANKVEGQDNLTISYNGEELRALIFDVDDFVGSQLYDDITGEPDTSGIFISLKQSIKDILNGSVRFDVAQTLTEDQKKQARTNIGASETDTGATSVEVTGDGNAVTTASYNASTRKLTLTKGTTFLIKHQSIKSINTNNTAAQTVNASEAITGSGTINLHKVSKTGNYNDLLNKPAIPDISGKLDKTTYEWNKEFAAGSNGAISLGRYNIYDTQLTFDISSTTSASMNGKLVIATQNGRICQAKVFGDASGVLVSKIVIYQSAIVNNRSWIEIFCNFDGWSKNKVHIYGVALESATVTNQMSSVTFTNGVPSPITSGDSKWNGTIDNDLSKKQDKLTAGSNITISGNTISAKDTTYSFIPTNPTLAWNTAISIGTIGGVDFTVKLPANPNTHQSIKSINTNNTTGQSVGSETVTGSGTINFHKIAKTGSYKDLLNQPTIGNGKVTIKVNETAYSFTVNQTGNTSVTIKIPITAASLDKDTKTLTLALA